MQTESRNLRILLAIGMLGVFGIIAAQAPAATYYSQANGDFNNAASWYDSTTMAAGDAYPVAADTARIGGGLSISVGSMTTATATTVQVGYDSATYTFLPPNSTSYLSLVSGGALNLSATSYLALGYTGGSTGIMNQTGGALTLGASSLYVGQSSTSEATTSGTGIYNFSGGSISQSTATKTYIGYQSGTNKASTGSFSISGNATGSSISLSYLYLNTGGTSGNTPTGNLAFAIGSTGVTDISCNRLYWGTTDPDLYISLLSAPPTDSNGNPNNVTLITTATTSGGAAGTFANLANGTVSATFGQTTYTWTVTTTGGTVSRDVDLINGTAVTAAPEPFITGPIAIGALLLVRRPNRRRDAVK